jgi:hypothetical protein
MSGFDTSQPITDETSLQDLETKGEATKAGSSAVTEGQRSEAELTEEELGDATPGPR